MLAFVIVLAACQKEDRSEVLSQSAVAEGLEGTYLGTFSRNGKTTDVSIRFTREGTFTGSSSNPKFPAICGGTYSQAGSSLVVNDTCAWTADFDWTLIFDGNWTIEDRGANKVRIWRTTGDVTDEYILGGMIR
jgi:hypothetical protein